MRLVMSMVKTMRRTMRANKCEGCGKFVRTNAEFVEHVKKIHAKDLDEEVVAIMDRHLLASSA